MDRETELGAFMAWLEERTPGNREFIDVEGFRGREIGFDLVKESEAYGLVEVVLTFGRCIARILPPGRRLAAQYRQRLKDPRWRIPAARTSLLLWLYRQDLEGVEYPVTSDILRDDESLYLGERLTETEIDRAAGYLYEKGLIEGTTTGETRGPVRARLTAQGQECVERNDGDVVAYQRDQRRAATVNNIGTINNHGGALAVGSSGFTQNVGIDPTTLAQLVQTMLDSLDTLRMTDAARTEARTELEAVAQELEQTDPEEARVNTGLGRAVQYVMDAGQPVVTALLMQIARAGGLPTA
ncbi:hypothetical protein [Polymorphospora sp. NPDC050346]|uniref:hypothetical protein n=1 Tax=Polymorphospora sp. NPDC050346 TaxID=3155780 RepID=UPI0033F2FC7B